jgi:hypothetical protein
MHFQACIRKSYGKRKENDKLKGRPCCGWGWAVEVGDSTFLVEAEKWRYKTAWGRVSLL